MSGDGSGRDPAATLGGILLIAFGACIAFVGGGCTIFTLWLTIGTYGDGLIFLLMSLGTLAIGIFGIWKGIRLLGGGERRDG